MSVLEIDGRFDATATQVVERFREVQPSVSLEEGRLRPGVMLVGDDGVLLQAREEDTLIVAMANLLQPNEAIVRYVVVNENQLSTNGLTRARIFGLLPVGKEDTPERRNTVRRAKIRNETTGTMLVLSVEGSKYHLYTHDDQGSPRRTDLAEFVE